jgi:hypothetical protein
MGDKLTDRAQAAYESLVQKLVAPPEAPELTDRQRAAYEGLVQKLVAKHREPTGTATKTSLPVPTI